MSKFLDAFGIDQLVVVGNHTGASIGISLATEEPERVRGLIVLGPPVFSKEEQEEWLVKSNYLEPFPLSVDGSHLNWIWERYERIWGAGTPAELLHLATTETLRVAFRYDWAYRAAFLFNAAELLPRVACPTLFLTTEGDTLRSKHEEAVALTRLAEGRVINFPNGQFPAREPQWFSEEVLGFLERIRFLK
jgi:pimeloyl-ACP methyl ester carboxylesterase